MICRPCRDAADAEADRIRLDPSLVPTGHDPSTCRDHGLTPSGCGCGHRPVREARTLLDRRGDRDV